VQMADTAPLAGEANAACNASSTIRSMAGSIASTAPSASPASTNADGTSPTSCSKCCSAGPFCQRGSLSAGHEIRPPINRSIAELAASSAALSVALGRWLACLYDETDRSTACAPASPTAALPVAMGPGGWGRSSHADGLNVPSAS